MWALPATGGSVKKCHQRTPNSKYIFRFFALVFPPFCRLVENLFRFFLVHFYCWFVVVVEIVFVVVSSSFIILFHSLLLCLVHCRFIWGKQFIFEMRFEFRFCYLFSRATKANNFNYFFCSVFGTTIPFEFGFVQNKMTLLSSEWQWWAFIYADIVVIQFNHNN